MVVVVVVVVLRVFLPCGAVPAAHSSGCESLERDGRHPNRKEAFARSATVPSSGWGNGIRPSWGWRHHSIIHHRTTLHPSCRSMGRKDDDDGAIVRPASRKGGGTFPFCSVFLSAAWVGTVPNKTCMLVYSMIWHSRSIPSCTMARTSHSFSSFASALFLVGRGGPRRCLFLVVVFLGAFFTPWPHDDEEDEEDMDHREEEEEEEEEDTKEMEECSSSGEEEKGGPIAWGGFARHRRPWCGGGGCETTTWDGENSFRRLPAAMIAEREGRRTRHHDDGVPVGHALPASF